MQANVKSETETLQERLSEVRDLLIELEFLKGDIKTIIDADNKYHEKVLSKSRFFYRLHINYIKLFVIDIYKLTGDWEDFNLKSVIEFCKINRNRINWHDPISLKKLNDLSNKLDFISDKFDRIKTLRNKYYAHNDKKKKEYKTNLSLIELWEVLSGLQEIFRQLNLHFDNLNWFFKIQYRSPNIIPKIYKYNKLHEVVYEEFQANKETIEINKLLGIILKR